MEDLVSSLRQYGAAEAFLDGFLKPTTVPYDTGQHDYQSLRAATSIKRREMIFDVVKGRFPLQCASLSKAAESRLLANATWLELLSL